MAQEGTYEYACMRAELLGLDKPDEETFKAEMKEKMMKMQEEEEIELTQLNDADLQRENLENISGGLDELNSILSITQKKLNRFKTVCGSLTNVLKIKVGYANSTESLNKDCEDLSGKEQENADDKDLEKGCVEANIEKEQEASKPRQKDFEQAVTSQVDRLDSLLTKADNAQYSMAHQNKQMKKFLK